MISALQTSVAGMMRASQRAERAADAILRAPVDNQRATATDATGATGATSDPLASEITAIVELSVAAQSYKANATAVAVTHDMLGKLIDNIS